jgi:hypothetical protein
MVSRLDKLAPYLAMLLFGYLAYSTTTERSLRAAGGKQAPVVGKTLLEPTLREPEAGASPVGRDPFEVEWSSYRGRAPAAPKPPASQPTSRPATRPATAPASQPLDREPPTLPKRFTAVITANRFQMAIIDDFLYKPGMLIGGDDPQRCWRVETIERSRVTLRFGDLRRTLTISEDRGASPAPRGGP